MSCLETKCHQSLSNTNTHTRTHRSWQVVLLLLNKIWLYHPVTVILQCTDGHKDNMCAVCAFKGGFMSLADVWTLHTLTAQWAARQYAALTLLPCTSPSAAWPVWALEMSVPTLMERRSFPSASCWLVVRLTPGCHSPSGILASLCYRLAPRSTKLYTTCGWIV